MSAWLLAPAISGILLGQSCAPGFGSASTEVSASQAAPAVAQVLVPSFSIPVYNDMIDTCQFWFYGRANGQPLDWRQQLINKKSQRLVTFVGEDPFEVTYRVGGVDYYGGPRNLLQVFRQNPGAVLVLQGSFKPVQERYAVYDPLAGQWITQTQVRQVRDSVIVTIVFRNGTGIRFGATPQGPR
jgi:hypothetical protein